MEAMICENVNVHERRNTPRMPYHTTALYNIAAVNGVGTIKDISSEGLFLEAPHALNRGDQIHIGFHLRHSKHPMDVSGEIVRRTPTGVGVRFLWS